MTSAPPFLHVLSIAFLALGGACAAGIAIDVVRHPQRMGVMNVVWPVTGLYGTVLAAWGYLRHGRVGTDGHDAPLHVAAAKGSTHCGSGCTLGDILAEWLALMAPGVLAAFGWPGLFDERTYAVWGLDYVFALAIGIVFQYFSIAPMRHLGLWDGLRAAFKADVLSLTAWQVGMYGFMAAANLGVARHVLGAPFKADMPEFWFMMQFAMLCGFLTSWPVNAWLIRRGWKERM